MIFVFLALFIVFLVLWLTKKTACAYPQQAAQDISDYKKRSAHYLMSINSQLISQFGGKEITSSSGIDSMVHTIKNNIKSVTPLQK